ncbi:acetoacetate--CoA ligase [Noviherbaspirillum sedimenti]|uniref:Acetoacetate--CoA ligase n=1 Tax=Noviherbaspirillum sedimenti TaxID=2320865 RepID=A0A3A3G6Q6_9BURK|nr:acetoacetate--CoA ligase [Noviherbaspirillum sedimenti]RJG03325.1 acetoacetate--CoA ligase [Noviherbaspirillum sedimenti]
MFLKDAPAWTPSAPQAAQSNMNAFRKAAERRWRVALPDYDALHAWSVNEPEKFWASVWDDAGIIGTMGERILIEKYRMPGARWFPGAQLNFAENLLRRADDSDALVFWGEDRVKARLSRAELRATVARFAAGLRRRGVVKGDRIAAYMPNMPQTVVAMLAATSIGAVFTSVSPDFGVQSVLDRFGQTEPKFLIACDGYFYGGKRVDCLGKVAAVADALSSIEHVVIVPYAGESPSLGTVRGAQWFDDFIAESAAEVDLAFEALPFDHPLYIMYSSGTTGVPKCIVHGAGGALLQQLKEHRLHCDVRPGDRVFYFTTCGWMMWNWLVSGLAAGATLLLYDGSPFAADNRILFDYADAEGMTHFGTSPKFLDTAAKLGLKPRETHGLEALRVVLSTGSPLVPEGFDYVYRDIKRDVQLSSISGGTDIISCFALGAPILPVWHGELQCRGLGMAVDVWNDDGKPVRGKKGELVCTRPFPSMPLGFWDDRDGSKYRAAYFERFRNAWSQGDFCEITEHGGLIIHGRSDATLNPGGVRIGTAEIYRQVEKLSEIQEAVVIGQDWPPAAPKDVRVVLFVKLREGKVLDDSLIAKIRKTIRENTTPRHVPARVLSVEDIPRTRTGKIVELAVRNAVHGRAVKNIEALANPESLAFFCCRPELRT